MHELALQILAMVGTAAGVYAAIRADLAAVKVKAELALELALQSHGRNPQP